MSTEKVGKIDAPIMINAFFCEDVRAEIGGTFTYVGAINNSIKIKEYPAKIDKLWIVSNINYEPDMNYKEFWILIRLNDEPMQELLHSKFDYQTEEIHTEKMSSVGKRRRNLVAYSSITDIEIDEETVFRVSVRVDNAFITCCAIKIST